MQHNGIPRSAPTKPMPKRALPNKPLPSKPLPSRPIPTSSKLQKSSMKDPSPSPTDARHPDDEKQVTDASQRDDSVHPKPEPDGSAVASNAKWYKGPPKNRRSLKPSKTCKAMGTLSAKVTRVKLFQPYDCFFSAVAVDQHSNRGFAVDAITGNEFGMAFAKLNVESGWRVTRVNGKEVPMHKSFAMLSRQIIDTAQKAKDRGYTLIFDGNPPPTMGGTEEEEKKNSHHQHHQHVHGDGKKKNTVELLSSYSDHKRVRVHHALDKYIMEFGSVKAPKGYKITALTSTFGGDLQCHGIGVGWRLLRLEQQDVSNMFTQKIKSTLDVQWNESKGQGIELTFGIPL